MCDFRAERTQNDLWWLGFMEKKDAPPAGSDGSGGGSTCSDQDQALSRL